MAWADADLKIFAAGLAIGGKWNNRGGSGSSSNENAGGFQVEFCHRSGINSLPFIIEYSLVDVTLIDE